MHQMMYASIKKYVDLLWLSYGLNTALAHVKNCKSVSFNINLL